jgi:hypothetical protein
MKKEWFYASLALAAGIAGGMVGGRLNLDGVGVAAEAAPKSLAAQQILLIGPNGKVRAALRMTKGGEPSLEFYDHAGQMRLALDIGADENPGLRLYDMKRALRLEVGINSDNVPALKVFDDQSRPRALLGVDADGEAGMNFYSGDGRILRELP